MQCFSTCSRTERNVLISDSWMKNTYIEKYNPIIFRIRAKILDDEKEDIVEDANDIIDSIDLKSYKNVQDNTLAKTFLCMAELFRVYCNDFGGKDIQNALELAKEIDHDLVKAHVYRYSHFFPNKSRKEKQDMLFEAEKIFKKYGINDHAIYCRNNALIHDLHTDRFSAKEFIEMQEEAAYTLPGMVGLSHIFNNTGVACLLKGDSERAVEFFEKGLERIKLDYRVVQKCALKTNHLIALAYRYQTISDIDLMSTMDLITNSMYGRVPHLAAIFMMNVIVIAAKQNKEFARELVHKYPVCTLTQKGLNIPTMSSGQLFLQLQYLETYCKGVLPLDTFSVPEQLSTVSGNRKSFIVRYGFNPMVFNIWI